MVSVMERPLRIHGKIGWIALVKYMHYEQDGYVLTWEVNLIDLTFNEVLKIAGWKDLLECVARWGGLLL